MSDAVAQDLRYSIRALYANPGLAVIAILSLALGIGANTTIFSLIDAVMLRSLPVSHPQELLEVKMGSRFFSNPIWEQLRDRQDVFSGIFAYGRWSFNLAKGGEARPVNGHFVSGQYFDTLGVRALLGRTLTPTDDTRGCPGAAVLSYGFWQREYGGQAGAIGKTISIDSHPIEIVGVAEPGFTGVEVGTSVDVMVPICAKQVIHGELGNLDTNAVPGATFLYSWLQAVGRLKPGITAKQATARLKTLAPEIYRETMPRDWAAEDQSNYLKGTFYTQPAMTGLSYLRREYRQTLLILMAIAGLVLLIACANVANLLLARGAMRQREIAIRMALGSSRTRLIRQLLTESLLLSITGTAAGALLAHWGVRLLVAFLDVSLDLTPDLRVLGFCAGLAVLTGLLFGIAPAWRGSQAAPQSAMKAGSRGVVAGSRFGAGRALVMAQLALSVPLVAGAGLMLSTFWRLTSLDPGFERDRILLANIDLRNGRYPPERRAAVYREMLEKVRAIPGVRTASASIVTPVCHCAYIDEIAIEGYTAKSRDDVTIHLNRVSDRYFETLGVKMLAGRDFNSHDTPASARVAIVNQTMARKYFGAANPIGKRYRVRRTNQLGDPIEIVGVVTDTKYESLREQIPPTAFTPLTQDPARAPLVNFELRAAGGDPTALITGAASAIGSVNQNASLQFTTLAETVNRSIEREQLLATLATLFGALALLLAAIGLYGVMSYTVARRQHEIGIRMALGAEPDRVLRMVLGEVTALIAAGLMVGLGLAVAGTRFVAAFLYGLEPNDPPTLSLAIALLAGVAIFAGYWPARRASRLDPMTALREE